MGHREKAPAPDADVAAAGGWKELESLPQCYQQADEATMLEVVLSGGKLRESKAHFRRYAGKAEGRYVSGGARRTVDAHGKVLTA